MKESLYPAVLAELQRGKEYKLQQKYANYQIGSAACGSLKMERPISANGNCYVVKSGNGTLHLSRSVKSANGAKTRAC